MASQKPNPILRGIVDTFVGAELIRLSAIPHRNRLSVILIDSAFETACRAYLQHVTRITLFEAHRHRDTLIKTIRSKLSSIDEQVWKDIDYFYEDIRCDFYHQSAGKTITDVTLLDYKDTVEFVIDTAFSVKIEDLVNAEMKNEGIASLSIAPSQTEQTLPPVAVLHTRLDKMILAVATLRPTGAEAVNAFFKKEGDAFRLKPKEFVDIVGRHSASKKFFYYDRAAKCWQLSGLGKFKLTQIIAELSNAI